MIDEDLTIFYSSALLHEYKSVILRKKFEKYIRPDQVDRFITLVLTRLKPVEIKTVVHLSRDVEDNYLLSISLDSSADYLVTGDPDLLTFNGVGKTKILTMAEFRTVID